MQQAIGEALNGLEIPSLPDGCIPTEAVMMVKFLDEDGDPSWAIRRTTGVPPVEEIGALRVMLRQSEDHFQSRWQSEGEA